MIDIGEVVAQSGVPTSTLHLWEREGLLAPVARNGLRRQYDDTILTRVALIVMAQRSNFSLKEIREFLTGSDPTSGRARLAQKLVDLRAQRAELDQVIGSLEHAVSCEAPSPMECPTFLAQLDDVLPTVRDV